VTKASKNSNDSGAPYRGLPTLILRRRDQAVAASISAFCLLLLLAQWFFFGGHRGQLVEFEEAESHPVAFLIDINRADWPEFTILPGIGETTAKRIVAYRDMHGPFPSHATLLKVEGIGERTLGRMGPFLLPVNQPTPAP